MFEKHCQICGTGVKKDTTAKGFWRYLYSQECPEQFVKSRAEGKRNSQLEAVR